MTRSPADRSRLSAAPDAPGSDFFTVLRVLVRRWPVVVVGAVVTCALALWIASSVGPTFEAKGSALLVGAESSNVSGVSRVNPYTRLDGSAIVLASVTAQIMDDPSVRKSLADAGSSADYQVGQATDGTPVLAVVATDADEPTALRTVDAVLNRIDEELDRRQADVGAPEESRIHAIRLTQPEDAAALLGGRLRAFAAVVLLGAAGTVSAAFLFDGYVRGRARPASVPRQDVA